MEQTFGYAPTYFPGTPVATDARRVTIGIGQEAAAIDFSLVPGRTATISGTVVDSRGAPVSSQNVGLTQEFRSANGGSFFSSNSASTRTDGTFTIKSARPANTS